MVLMILYHCLKMHPQTHSSSIDRNGYKCIANLIHNIIARYEANPEIFNFNTISYLLMHCGLESKKYCPGWQAGKIQYCMGYFIKVSTLEPSLNDEDSTARS
jgi:hypothetical protein